MPQQIELTAEQLSALDQIISQKQKGEAILTDIVNAVVDVAPAVIAVTQITAQIIGGAAAMSTEDLVNSSLKDIVSNMPVEKLIELRKNAIQKS